MSFDGSRGPPSIEGMTSLKVDNLTYRTTIEDLKRVFQKHGDVGDVYIPRDPRNHESRGFAFVRFFEKRDAEDAMDSVDGMVLDGREIRVQNAKYGRPASDYRPRGPRGGGGRYGGGGGGGGGGSRYRRSYSPRRRRSRSRSYSPRRRSRSKSPRRKKSRSKSHSPRRRPQSKSPQPTRRDSNSRSPKRQRSRSGSPKHRSRSPARSGSPAENGSKSPSQDGDNE